MADLTISVDIDASGTKRGAAEAKSAVKGIRDSIAGMDFAKLGENLKYAGAIAQVVGDKLMRVGTALTIGVTAPILAVGKAIITAGGEYEKALNVFQAVTKATGEEMDRAAKVAKDLGADLSLPATSAKDAALAMTELGKAGLTAAESMDAAKGVLQLAAAGELDAAEAAKIAANALNAFGLEAKETTRIANLLAGAANASSADVGDLALAMQQAGSSFATAKMPIEDMVTAISALANAGIKGSDAGTSLKTFIQSLAAPSSKAAETMKELGIAVFDASGKMKQMPEIIGQFQTALAGLTDEQQAAALYKIFGSDAIRAAQILFKTGTEGFAKLKEQVTAAGAAADLANSRMKGLSGAWAGMKSQLETLGIEIYEVIKAPLTEFLRNLAEIISRATQAFSQLTPQMQYVVIAVAAFAAALGPVLIIVGSLVSAIGTLISAAGAISSAIGAIGGLAVAGPIIAAIVIGIGQLAAVAAALYLAWQTNFGGIRDLTQVVAAAVMEAWDWLMAELSDLTSQVLAEVLAFWEKNKEDILAIVQAFSETFRAIWTEIVQFWREHNTEIKEIAQTIWNLIKDIIVTSVKIIGDVITLFLKVIRGDWAGAWEATKVLLSDVTAAWIRIMLGIQIALVDAVKTVLQGIWNLHAWVLEQGLELGRAIAQGIVNGILSMNIAVAEAARRLAQAAVDKIKSTLQIESPSKVMHELGMHTAQGLADGIKDGTAEAAKAAGTIGGKIIEGLQQIFGGDLGGFIQNALGVLTDSSRSWGDRLKSIFGGIAQNFRKMVSDMLSTWINSKLFGGSGSGSSGGGVGPGGTAPWNPGSGSGGSIFSQIPGSTGSINSNGEYVVNGNQQAPFQFGNFSNMTNSIGTIAGIGTMVGGAIGGKAGNLISSVSGGALTGLMLGLKFGAIGGPLGAAIGAAAGFAMSILGGLFSSPKRKRDKNEKMPQLQKGFLDALTQLKALAADKNAILSNPSGAMSKADELRAAIASGFGIQFESKKYGKIAQQQIAQKLAEADVLVKQIKEFAEVSRAANERDRRLIPEFAGGVYMSPAFMSFRRRNGMLGGSFTGRDTIPAMLGPGEAVLNPRQMATIKAQAGFDVFKTAGIPGYAGGAMMPASFPSQTMQMGDINVTVVVEQDAEGMWHATAQSAAGQKVIAKVVSNGFANDEIKTKRRGA